jgi:hypothetical protein
MSTPVREVDLLEAGQARVGLERHSQLFRTNTTDRVVREVKVADRVRPYLLKLIRESGHGHFATTLDFQLREF